VLQIENKQRKKKQDETKQKREHTPIKVGLWDPEKRKQNPSSMPLV